MLNKISIFIIIILSNLFFSSVYSNDQLNFDISQIEILDKGNKIVGKKRGKISTNDGITIDADQFEYDKIKNILKASGNIRIKDEINNYDIYSDNVLYSKKSEKIELFSYRNRSPIVKIDLISILYLFNVYFFWDNYDQYQKF